MIRLALKEFTDHKLVIIEDSVDCNADNIFKAFLFQAININAKNVYLICIENQPLLYTSGAHKEVSYLHYQSLFLDYDKDESFLFKSLSLSSLVIERVEKLIFIDSINTFIWDCGLSQFIKELSKLMNLGYHFVVRVHRDALFEVNDLSSLLYYSTCHLRTCDRFGFNKFLIETTLKKTDKKLLGKKGMEKISVGDDYSITYIADDVKPKLINDSSTAMNALTTFNLGTQLSETEKLARKQLVLPYLRTSDNAESLITYEADEADLEEDPDEDLEL